MSAHKPRHVYIVVYTYEDGPEGGVLAGLYHTFTAAKRAVDTYRKAGPERWTNWSVTRDRTGRVQRAEVSTVPDESTYDDATEVWSTPGVAATLDIYHRMVDDTTSLSVKI